MSKELGRQVCVCSRHVCADAAAPGQPPRRLGWNVAGAAVLPLGKVFILSMKSANIQGTCGSLKKKFCSNLTEIDTRWL